MARSTAPGHFAGGSSARNAWSPAGGGVHSSGGGVHSSGLGGHGAAGGFSSDVRHGALNHYGDAHHDYNRFSFVPSHNVYGSHWSGYRPHYSHYPHYAFFGFGLGFYGSYWPSYYSYGYPYSYAYPASYTYPVSYSDSAAYAPTYYYEEPATTNSYPVSTNVLSGTLSPKEQPAQAAPEDSVMPRPLVPSREAPEALPEDNKAQPDTNKPPAEPSPQKDATTGDPP